MFKWLLHLTGRRESPFWSRDWVEVGSETVINIIDVRGDSIRVEIMMKEKYRHKDTGETWLEDGWRFRTTNWHFLDNKEDWPDNVKRTYQKYTTVPNDE